MNRIDRYEDGFKIRAYNRRVSCIKVGSDWFLTFIHYHKTLFTDKERAHFDLTFDRFHRTLTKVTVRLTDEMFRMIGEGIIRFHYDN